MTKELKPIKETALAMLARREHGVAELRRKLLDKGYGPGEVGTVVAALEAARLVDDRRFAAARARHRAELSRWGAQRIRQELQMKGVGPDDVEAAFAALDDEGVVFAETAEKAARRKFRQPLPDVTEEQGVVGMARMEALQARQKERQKRVGYLVRRGFSFAEASAAVEAAELEET